MLKLKSALLIFSIFYLILSCESKTHLTTEAKLQIDFLNELINSQILDDEKGLASTPKNIPKNALDSYIETIKEDSIKKKRIDDLNQEVLDSSFKIVDGKIHVDSSAYSKHLMYFSHRNWTLSLKETYELKEYLNSIKQETKFAKDLLKFNKNNDSIWYEISIPIFTKDKKHAYLSISEYCLLFMCGYHKEVLLSKNENGIWEENILSQAHS